MTPDFNILMSAILRNPNPTRVPLYEHGIDYEVMAVVSGLGPPPWLGQVILEASHRILPSDGVRLRAHGDGAEVSGDQPSHHRGYGRTRLINDVGIDATHSWEDVIVPVQEAKALLGGRIGILGGVDVDYLCRHTKQECYDYTMAILDACAPGGGFALGSGNTIANYIPVDNYLAMLAAWRADNGA